MRCYRILLLLGAQWLAFVPTTAASQPPDQPAMTNAASVVLLHGLGRTARAMACLEAPLQQAGYTVHNIAYPSRSKPIPALADGVAQELRQLGLSERPINAVTHSMGGILLRQMAADEQVAIKRAVMFSPPNHGSEVIDHMRKLPGFASVMGPAALQMHTGNDSVPNSLGPVPFDVSIIAGTRSYNPLFSRWIAGEDDGKVSVASARLDGMQAFAALPLNHTRMMCDAQAQQYVLAFLRSGQFPSEQ